MYKDSETSILIDEPKADQANFSQFIFHEGDDSFKIPQPRLTVLTKSIKEKKKIPKDPKAVFITSLYKRTSDLEPIYGSQISTERDNAKIFSNVNLSYSHVESIKNE